MFHVVEFVTNKSVAVVPQSWYEDGCASWPTYNSDERINRAVKHGEEPQEDWQTHDVRIIKSSDTYIEARQILKKALTCSTSDLQTEDEQERPGRRRTTAKHFFGDTDTEEDYRPPKISKFGSSAGTSHQLPANSPELCQMFGRTAPPQPPPPLPPQTLLSQPAHCNQQQRGPEEPSQVYRPTWRGGRHGPETIPCSAAQVHILSLLEHIKQQQDQLVAKVNHLSSRVLNTSTPQEPECPECIQLPIDSLEAVDELEAFLKDAANAAAKQRMISSLATIGGQDVKRVAWNILSRMFTEEVAKTISWKGANGKRAFSHMSSKTLMYRAVRANSLCRTATDTDIQRYAIRWFNLAADRGAARRRLTNRSNQAEADD
ncbi:uncharacterized protein LOC128026838 [Carassius gibelio]|uniref:uncharacterized protein LOC128026838 n=1 Tax=Carassius gibelio TaxID=101364 RepID=UPI0022797622|nr:uncharacterized protein LOC128026838 [Carassius gibelio]